MVSAAEELERVRSEAAELRALVRTLSRRLEAAIADLPLDAALALARGDGATAERPFRLEHWDETIAMTRAEVAPELALLWKRLPPREPA